MIVAGEALGVSRATALLSEVVSWARRQSGKTASGRSGPCSSCLFRSLIRGRARIGRAAAELRRAEQDILRAGRADARRRPARCASGCRGQRTVRAYSRDILLPLRERIVSETQLQYNAMQLGVFELLRAREQQIQAAIAYIETLRDYWLARTDLGQLLSGRLPRVKGTAMGRRETAPDDG